VPDHTKIKTQPHGGAATVAETDGKPADHAALADKVHAGLLDEIIGGRLQPGARVKEREVSARFAVSRVPVRQAIHRLEGDGFLLTEPNRGAVVRRIGVADVNDLFDARLCIEPYGTRMAANRVAQGVADPQSMLRILDQDRVQTAVAASGLSLRLELHAEIIRLSGSDLLIGCLRPMLGRMEWIFRLTTDLRDQHSEHEQICAAIVAGNADLAANLAFTHIELGRIPTLAALEPILHE
jgi:DNA-binding GntR family transcriptional regulator